MSMKDYEELKNDFDDDVDLLHCDITNMIDQIHALRFDGKNNCSNIRQQDIVNELKNIYNSLHDIKKEMNCEGEFK